MFDDAHCLPQTFRLVDRALYACKIGGIHALRCVTCGLGRRGSLQFGRLLGRALYAMAGRLRNKMLLNLDIAFGTTMTAQQKERIARDACAHFCANWADVFHAGGERLGAALQSISVRGRENLDSALQRGCGVIAVSAHMGTYSLLGPRLERDGYRFLMVVRDLESPSGSAMYARCRELIGLRAVFFRPQRLDRDRSGRAGPALRRTDCADVHCAQPGRHADHSHP